MKGTFHFIQKPYNLRNDPELQRQRNRTMYFGTESISSLATKIWELIPSTTRNANSLGKFKEIKHTTCSVTLSSFSNNLLYISNFSRCNNEK